MYWLAAGRLPGPTVTVPRMTVPRVSLKSTAVDRLPLADDDIEASRCGPVLIVHVNGVGLARVDVHLIRPVGRRASLALAVVHPLAGTEGVDLDARDGRAVGADNTAPDRLGPCQPGGDRPILALLQHHATAGRSLRMIGQKMSSLLVAGSQSKVATPSGPVVASKIRLEKLT